MPHDRCLLDVPVSHTASQTSHARGGKKRELQPIITASVCGGFVEVLESVVNFVLNGILIGFDF